MQNRESLHNLDLQGCGMKKEERDFAELAGIWDENREHDRICKDLG